MKILVFTALVTSISGRYLPNDGEDQIPREKRKTVYFFKPFEKWNHKKHHSFYKTQLSQPDGNLVAIETDYDAIEKMKENLKLEEDKIGKPLGQEDLDFEPDFRTLLGIHSEGPGLYNPDLFEGDIIGVKIADNMEGRGVLKRVGARWPEGIIPYIISQDFDQNERSAIAKAMENFHQNTCIKFVPADQMRDANYVHIQKGSSCSSLVGRSESKGGQPLSLGNGCLHLHTAVHELMHAAGFFHEQSRPDRDNFVQILYENIKSGLEDNFQKYSTAESDTLGFPYDIHSVMHYSGTAFSKNGNPTMVPIDRSVGEVGARFDMGLNPEDIQKINTYYKCSGSSKVVTNPPPRTTDADKIYYTTTARLLQKVTTTRVLMTTRSPGRHTPNTASTPRNNGPFTTYIPYS